MSQETQQKYQHRCELNLECLVILNKKVKLTHFNKMIMATPKDEEEMDDMKYFIDKRNNVETDKVLFTLKKNKEDSEKEISEVSKNMQQEMRAMEARIVNLLKKD